MEQKWYIKLQNNQILKLFNMHFAMKNKRAFKSLWISESMLEPDHWALTIQI